MARKKRYFHINAVPYKDHLESIMLYLEGDALSWFLWAEEHLKFASWQELHTGLDERFNMLDSAAAYQILLSIIQTNSVF